MIPGSKDDSPRSRHALTICQPYAHLIIHGDNTGRIKQVENRTWPTSHRGWLVIHAGKSRDWLDIATDDSTEFEYDEEYGIALSQMAFGAVIGCVWLDDCLRADDLLAGMHDATYPGISSHEHVKGPWCWVLTAPQKIDTPVPYRGAQGLWRLPESVWPGPFPHVLSTSPNRAAVPP